MDHAIPDTGPGTGRAYRAPADVLAAYDLTAAQKIRLLRQWEYDLRLLMVATDENMHDHQQVEHAEGDQSEHAAEALIEVRRCLAALDADDLSTSASTKAG